VFLSLTIALSSALMSMGSSSAGFSDFGSSPRSRASRRSRARSWFMAIIRSERFRLSSGVISYFLATGDLPDQAGEPAPPGAGLVEFALAVQLVGCLGLPRPLPARPR